MGEGERPVEFVRGRLLTEAEWAAALARAAHQPDSTVDLDRAERFLRSAAARWETQRWDDTAKCFVEITAEVDRLRAGGDELAAAVVGLVLAREDVTRARPGDRERAVAAADARLRAAAHSWRAFRGGDPG